jgi:hypothetical protein
VIGASLSRRLDHESRANRFLDAMSAVKDMLGGAAPNFEINATELAQLLSLLSDEARLVVIPSRLCANDQEEDEP